jgi:hypothetical protein
MLKPLAIEDLPPITEQSPIRIGQHCQEDYYMLLGLPDEHIAYTALMCLNLGMDYDT